MGKDVSKTLKWMDGGRNREAVLRDPRQERRDLEHTEMEWLGRLSDGGGGRILGYSMVLPLLSGKVDVLGCSSPENWGVDTTGVEGRGGAHDTPDPCLLSSAPLPLRLPVSVSPRERKEGTWVSLVPYLWRQPADAERQEAEARGGAGFLPKAEVALLEG